MTAGAPASVVPVGRYSKPRRRELPDGPERRAAQRLARQRQAALAKADRLYDEMLTAIAELRRTTPPHSYTEIAEIVGVTKARAQQLVRECEDRGLL